ncbi:MAG: biotin-dependent carboxyltransferase family protein [Devosia sp.]|nr:biotin-dependent carboxyltransferase family protein [Devosia sp.]
MTAALRLTRVGPSATVQDAGRFGLLQHGISASGPMDRGAFDRAGKALGDPGSAGVEFTLAGLDFVVVGEALRGGFLGGSFSLRINGVAQSWPYVGDLAPGDRVEITPGPAGNYGYCRLDREIGVPLLLGSRSTNLIAALGGLDGRALRAGDVLPLATVAGSGERDAATPAAVPIDSDPIRFVWGIHADLFAPATRRAFTEERFTVSNRLDRMGVRLDDPAGVFAGAPILSLVSDAIVAGDVQILGDGTPIVLMRDHQPTGGYPRIATVITVDLDRFAQLRPSSTLAFTPITLQKARRLYLESRAR